MADFDVTNPKYSNQIRKLEPTDLAHADTFNPLFRQLIENDVVISELLKEKLKIGDDYRPNLLHNGDFKINGNGKTTFGTPYEYTLDKWQLLINGEVTNNGTVTVNTGFITLTKASGAPFMYIHQLFDKYTYSKLRNKTVTCSFKYRGSETRLNIRCNNSDTYYTEQAFNATNDWKIASYTWTVPDIDLIELRVAIMLKGTGAMSSDVEWIKLELNDHATPFIPKSYKEELLNCSENLGYAPNLLINGDFQVWQRGTSFDYTSKTGRFYSADRWCAFRAGYAAGLKVSKNGRYLIATNPADGSFLSLTQSLENATCIALRGKTITASAKIKSNAPNAEIGISLLYQNSGEFYPGAGAEGTVVNKSFIIGTDFVIVTCTGIVPESINGLEINLYTSQGVTLTVEYAKVEVNDHATPFIPRPYGEELRDCQRYYEVNGISFQRAYNQSSINKNMTDLLTIPFKVTKRVVPVVIFKYDIADGTETTATANISYVGGFSDTNIQVPPGYYLDINSWTADAEI